MNFSKSVLKIINPAPGETRSITDVTPALSINVASIKEFTGSYADALAGSKQLKTYFENNILELYVNGSKLKFWPPTVVQNYKASIQSERTTSAYYEGVQAEQAATQAQLEKSLSYTTHVDDGGGSLTVDNDGNFPVQATVEGLVTVVPDGAIIDNNNSSDVALGSGETFTGQSIEVTQFPQAAVNVFASHSGTLYLEYSPNGLDWDLSDSYSVAAATHLLFAYSPHAKYFRVVFTNGGTPQTYFRLQTILRPTPQNADIGPVSVLIDSSDVALTTRGVIMGKTTGGGGGYVDVKVNPSGALTVEATVTGSTLPTGAATEATLSGLNAKFGTLGQKTMAGSAPVVLASDQSAIQVTAASLPLPAGASTEATLALIKAKTDNLDVALSTRLKPADTLTEVTTVGTITNVVHVDDNSSTLSVDDGGGTLTVDGSVAIGAGSSDIGKVRFSLPATDAMSEAIIDFISTGDNTVVSGTALQTIRVYRIFFIVSAATNVTVKDGAGTALTGAMPLPVGGSMSLDLDGEPWFTTSAGNALVINQSGTAQVSGRAYYVKS